MEYKESDTTCQSYRSRLRRMIKWVHENYVEARDREIRSIPPDELIDNNKYYDQKRDTMDFDYRIINVEYIKAYITTQKHVNANGTGQPRSFSHVRKFHDAVLFGARKQNAQLPSVYQQEMKKFLDGIKKELNSCKKSNNNSTEKKLGNKILPITNDIDQLSKLKKKVTINLPPNVQQLTEVPHHMVTQSILDRLVVEVNNLKEEYIKIKELIHDTCRKVIDKNDARSMLTVIHAIKKVIDDNFNPIHNRFDVMLREIYTVKCEIYNINNPKNQNTGLLHDKNDDCTDVTESMGLSNDNDFNHDVTNQDTGLLNNGTSRLLDSTSNAQSSPETMDFSIHKNNLPNADGLVMLKDGYISIYMYNEAFFHVPKDFTFPKNPNRFMGWKLWLLGNSSHTYMENGRVVNAPIRPYRLLKCSSLPSKNLGNIFSSAYKPIFSMMQQCPGLDIPDHPAKITDVFLHSSFEKATKYLKERVSYIFNLGKTIDIDCWSIATWSLHVSVGKIHKYGTESDKLLAPMNAKCGPKKNPRMIVPKNNAKDRYNKANVNSHLLVNNNSRNSITEPVCTAEGIQKKTPTIVEVEDSLSRSIGLCGLVSPPLTTVPAVRVHEEYGGSTSLIPVSIVPDDEKKRGTCSVSKTTTKRKYNMALGEQPERHKDVDDWDDENSKKIRS